MIPRRSKSEIYLDILNSVQKNGKMKKTHIMYTANLTHKRLEKYLGMLLMNNFLEKANEKDHTYYILTKQGYKFLSDFRKLKKFSEAFGLSI